VLTEDELRDAAAIRFALRKFHAASDRVVRAAGLTPRRYLLLLAIESTAARKQRAAVGDLAAAIDLAPSTMSGLVDRAEAVGLVMRRRASGDARVIYVSATAEGKRRFRRAFRELEPERASLLHALGPMTRGGTLEDGRSDVVGSRADRSDEAPTKARPTTGD
jgi:DNA-binding MarR family transcriptional regulator